MFESLGLREIRLDFWNLVHAETAFACVQFKNLFFDEVIEQWFSHHVLNSQILVCWCLQSRSQFKGRLQFFQLLIPFVRHCECII